MNKEIKCNKDSPCLDCQKTQQELLAKIEDWEVKRKEKIEKFEFIEAEFCHNRIASNDKVKYSGDESYKYYSVPCSSCQQVIRTIKSNSYGDEKELEHECKQSSHTPERERERERASNNISSKTISIPSPSKPMENY